MMVVVVVIRGRKGSIGCGHGADDVTSGGVMATVVVMAIPTVGVGE